MIAFPQATSKMNYRQVKLRSIFSDRIMFAWRVAASRDLVQRLFVLSWAGCILGCLVGCQDQPATPPADTSAAPQSSVTALAGLPIPEIIEEDGVKLIKVTGPTMGSYYAITIANPPASFPDDWQISIDQELRKINDLMSTYLETSELSQFNQSSSLEWFSVSPELAFVIHSAQEISHSSEGAFDITVGPLVNAWNFGPNKRSKTPPSEEVIEQARQRVGYKNLEVRLDPPALKKSIADLRVDLNAIAPGYGTDRLVSILQKLGCENVFVDISGEVRATGIRGNRPWRVAIEDPSESDRKYHLAFELKDRAIATSGDYRNFFEYEGKRYSHTVDPRTGRPVDHGVASVSVFAESSMLSDGWATAMTVLGMDDGLELANKLDMSVLIVRRNQDGSFEERQSKSFPESLPLQGI